MARKYPGWLILLRSAERILALFKAEEIDPEELAERLKDLLLQINARLGEEFPPDRLGRVLLSVCRATCAIGPIWPDIIVDFFIYQTDDLDDLRGLLHGIYPFDWTVGKSPDDDRIAVYSPLGVGSLHACIEGIESQLTHHAQRSDCSHLN